MSSSASVLVRSAVVGDKGVTDVRFLGKVALGVIGNQERVTKLGAGVVAEDAMIAGKKAAGTALAEAGFAGAEAVGARVAIDHNGSNFAYCVGFGSCRFTPRYPIRIELFPAK